MWITLCLILCCCFHRNAIADECSIQPMNSSGLYIEEIASLKTYYTEWKIVTYINLTIYNGEYEKLKSMVNKTEELCLKLDNYFDYQDNPNHITGCKQTLNQIDNLMMEIDDYHTSWFLPKHHSISKRGLINPIGSVYRFLFGTLDSSDGEYYLKEFESLNQNNNLQNSIIKNQTSLMQSTVNAMKRMDKRINNTIGHIEQIIKRYDGPINYMLQESGIFILKQTANELFNHITLAIMQFMHNQKTYLNTISLNQNNVNNPNLIPPKLFYNELRKIQSNIATMELDLPAKVDFKNLALFYQLSRAESIIIEDQLIIRFILPIVNTKKYNLYKSTSLPVLIKEKLYNFIVPHHEFVALDDDKDKYIPITKEELKSCLQINEKNLICKETFPIMSAIGTNICEINILRMEKVSNECNIRIANFSAEIWIKLNQPNAYVFVFPTRQYVHISCTQKKYNQFLEGTGAIYLDQGCSIKTNSIILHTFKTTTTEIYRHNAPIIHIDVNITEIANKILKIENFHVSEIVHPSIINQGEQELLDSISLGLKDIQEMEEKLIYKLSPKELKNNIFSLFVLFAIIAVIVLIIYIRFFVKKGMKIKATVLHATPV